MATRGQDSNAFEPPLDRERHLRYWQRCVRSLLPHQYTSNDSIRMTLGFFIVSAIDLLAPSSSSSTSTSTKPPLLSRSDRRRFREWVLSCQHSRGGFCGSTSHTLPRHEYEGWDFASSTPKMGSPGAANIAATSFALILLVLLAEPGPEPKTAELAFSGVNRAATLGWLRQLQRPDGSFGEVLVELPARAAQEVEGGGDHKGDHTGDHRVDHRVQRTVEGGRDMRTCYLAALIRWILRGDLTEGSPDWVDDFDVGALVQHIRNSQTYDGGVAENSMNESHAGYAYCAVAALSLLDRPTEGSPSSHPSKLLREGAIDIPHLINSLASRQFVYVEPIRTGDGAEVGDDDGSQQPPSLSRLALCEDDVRHIGFNGRCNKVADTCYCWWVSGTLGILGEVDMVTRPASRRFLMDKTQHLIGGFGKHPGSSPDIYHAYLGLAALATLGEPGLKEIDASLCVSTETVRRIEAARRGLLRNTSRPETSEGHILEKHGFGYLQEMAETLAGRKVEWLTA